MQTIDIEALKKEVAKAGGTWQDMGGPDRPVRPETARRQVELLTSLKGVLEDALLAKQRELEQLQVTLARVQHGGGR